VEEPAGPFPDQSRGLGTALGLETVELGRRRIVRRDEVIEGGEVDCSSH